MSVFSGVMAILSPNFVTRFLKESGRDVLSKLQTEYGVNCMRTSEDVCTVQGEWEAMLKVHSFLKEAENSTAVAAKGRAGGPLPCNTVGVEQRNGGGVTSSLGSNDDHSSDFQIMGSWGSAENGGLGAAGLAHDEPTTFSLTNGPDAQPSLGTVIHIVPTAGSNSSSRSLLSNMPKLTYKGQAPPPPPPLQPINRDPSSYPDHETDIKPSILVDENFMTNLKLTPPKRKKSPKAIAKKSTAKKAGTAAKELKKKLKEKTPAAAALAASLSPVMSQNLAQSDGVPAIKTEPVEDSDMQGDSINESLGNTDLLDDMPVLTKQIDSSPSLSVTPTKSEGGLDCLKCKKVFSEHKELEVHMYVYHNPDCIGKEIQCPYCSKIFLSKNGLEEHMYNHVGTRPFSCHLCPVSFNHRKSLRRHLERHSNTRKFSCDQCSLTFMRKEALDTHRLIHQKEYNPSARMACTVCDEKFDNMASYRKHMQYDHYEINETLNLGPTTHLEEVEGFEDDEDVVDLFKDEGDDGDWRKPKKKTKAKAPAKGAKRKAPAKSASPKKKKKDNDTLSDADASFDASSIAEGDNEIDGQESVLDEPNDSSARIISKSGGDPVFGHEEEPIIDQDTLSKDKPSNDREESDNSNEKPSKKEKGMVSSKEDDKKAASPNRDKNVASPATPASEHSSESNDSSGDESSSSSSSKSEDSD